MAYAATPSGARIEISGSVGAAYRLARDNVRVAADLGWLPFAILAAAELLSLIVGHGWFGQAVAALVRTIVFVLFGGAFMVRWHRFVLLGESIPTRVFPAGFAAFLLEAVKIGAAVAIGYIVLGVVAVMPPHLLTAPVAFGGAIVLGFAAARLSLVFPAAAVEQPLGLVEAWNVVAGNYWRMLGCLLLCYVPFGVLHYLLGMLALALPAALWIAMQLIALVVSFAGLAVLAALLSTLYRDLAGQPAPPARLTA